MSSVIDGTCQQIEQLAESYIHALKFLKTNDEASLKETLENGDKLMQIWIASCSQLPPHFKEKVRFFSFDIPLDMTFDILGCQ